MMTQKGYFLFHYSATANFRQETLEITVKEIIHEFIKKIKFLNSHLLPNEFWNIFNAFYAIINRQSKIRSI